MGWSRNLGKVTLTTVQEVAREATTEAVPNHVTKKFDVTSQLSPEDEQILEHAVTMALRGLETMGGEGDVHIGGQVHSLPNGSVQRSITATVTVTIK